MRQLMSEFSGKRLDAKPEDGEMADWGGSGDVKYHLGTSYNRPTTNGKMVHLSLVANPSHLEAVNTVVLGKVRAKQHYAVMMTGAPLITLKPSTALCCARSGLSSTMHGHLEAVNTVVLGKVRAKQYFAGDDERGASMPILLHGDGAFSGQGIVYETLDMSQLTDYTVGGCIHLVVNNQLAAEWRQKFKSDVVIDIVCYRKYGHNEIDEPMFTQPLMYSQIKKHKNSHQQYIERLLAEGFITQEGVQSIHDKILSTLNTEFDLAKDYKPQKKDWLASHWEGFYSPGQMSKIRNTGVKMDILKQVGKTITTIPDTFTPHRQIKKVYETRRKMVDSGEGIDWGMAEALAFATLVSEGTHVRLSGQDVERGTFSHRHSVIHDQVNGDKYTPLCNVYPGQDKQMCTVTNSSLSEFGVLGFELGYSMESPNSLVIWEAQFGDFANGAQVIFDQFLSSGEAKWLRQTGLVVLLPHGYDGQGPEHSSCRLERFLQMSDENPYVLPNVDEGQWFTGAHLGTQIQNTNWQVVNITTPANYFMALRRQIQRQFRKPLIVAAPKNLLRHPKAKSGLWELDDQPDDAGIVGVRFKRLIMDDTGLSPKSRAPKPEPETGTKRIVFCSGKVFYDLHAEREKLGKNDGGIAIVRLEQLAPFPFDLVAREIRRYPNAEVVWCQEEPMNMGAYFHIQPRLISCLRSEDRDVVYGRVKYVGRAPSASPATGFGQVHAQEQAQLCDEALDLNV
eukprot:gene27387-4689_t